MTAPQGPSSETLSTETSPGVPILRDERRTIPAILVIGSAEEGPPIGSGAVISFGHRLGIGRRNRDLADADGVWMVADQLVSRRHAEIDERDGQFFLTDLGSRNGTTVDRAPVGQAPQRLHDGSLIGVGQVWGVFRMLSGCDLDVLREERRQPFVRLPTASPGLASISHKLRKLAPTGGELLLGGETGVGKEVYARAIHEASGRRGRFVAVNCAALPRELVESELFGFARGAHSEARTDKRGLIEEADGGTLFLDEIGDMSPELQAKLLRFLQDKELLPLGASRGRHIDVRVIAATNRSVVAAGSPASGLRLDLATRLGAAPLIFPPLRARKEDLGRLCADIFAGLGQAPWRRFEPTAFEALCFHDFPGNVRELAKVLETAVALAGDEEMIAFRHLPAHLGAEPRMPSPISRVTPAEGAGGFGEHGTPTPGPRPAPSAAELETLLRRFSGNVARVARELGRKPPLIYRWCHRHGLDPDSFRPARDA